LPLTPPAWISLATGKNPGKHGVYEFSKRVGYETYLVTKSTAPNCESLWEIMSRNGKKVGVINVPFTYPPDEVNGVMISGMMTPSIETDFVFPANMKEEIFKIVPGYQLDVDQEDILHYSGTDALLKRVFEDTNGLRTLTNYLLDKSKWDLFYVVFVGPDRLQHFLWNDILSADPDCVRYYKLLDDILGDILAKVEDDRVLFIVSDHGFKSAEKGFFINSFFREAELLEVRGNPKVKKMFTKMGITGDTINKVLESVGLARLKASLPSWPIARIRRLFHLGGIQKEDIDWGKTQVFSLLGYGNVYVNLKGREPEGIVEERDYERVCEMVIERLLSVKDPDTGKGIVRSVDRGSEIYPDATANERPDLVVIMEEGYSIRAGLGKDIISMNKLRDLHIEGYHDSDGLFMAYGNVIKSRKTNADICDIMPTILYLLGLPIPEDVDGRVLTEVVDDTFVERNHVQFEKKTKLKPSEHKALTEEEVAKLEKHLRGLGYMD